MSGHLLANRQCGTRHWELWLCRCQSGKPEGNIPRKETPRGRDDGEVAQRFKWLTWDGEVDVWREFVGGFWVIWGVDVFFFCQPDNLGVNDSRFDFLVDTFPNVSFGVKVPWFKVSGRQFPMVMIPDDFPMGRIGWNLSTSTSTLRRPVFSRLRSLPKSDTFLVTHFWLLVANHSKNLDLS